jgi:hypothetical protein
MANKRHSKGKMYALIRKWEQSGLSQAKFFKEHKISKSTFGYWRKKYLREQVQIKTQGKMVPIHIEPPEEPATSEPATSIEIVYPNGVRVVCPAQMDASRIKGLIF